MYKEKKSIVHFEEVMMFPIKSHLPLITTRIEFQLKELPPPPQTCFEWAIAIAWHV